MAHQIGNLTTSLSSSYYQQPFNSMPRTSSKRRMDEDDNDTGYQQSLTSTSTTKRHFDLNTQFSPEEPKQEPLPAITYASPDYRPPPPTETPLWLQPMPSNANSPMTEDGYSEDDNALLTPSLQKLQQQQDDKPYWGDMMVDQWQ
ncbi:hypothetical protein BD560DRAFT_396555 [Blakeslea trispora]|nr:hypothetical protein BD560DRAFT_396555 [Blakeslea trispora]